MKQSEIAVGGLLLIAVIIQYSYIFSAALLIPPQPVRTLLFVPFTMLTSCFITETEEPVL